MKHRRANVDAKNRQNSPPWFWDLKGVRESSQLGGGWKFRYPRRHVEPKLVT